MFLIERVLILQTGTVPRTSVQDRQ